MLIRVVNSTLTEYNTAFNEWISWVLRRWRAQQSAIIDAICRNSWVIIFLNAIGTGINKFRYEWRREGLIIILWKRDGSEVELDLVLTLPLNWWLSIVLEGFALLLLFDLLSLCNCVKFGLEKGPLITIIFPSSFHSRLPAEFKHINQRRKRNQQGWPQ